MFLKTSTASAIIERFVFRCRKIFGTHERTTEIILNRLREVLKGTPESDLSGLEFRTFKSLDVIRVGDVEVRPIHVDHSVPRSYAFLADADGMTLAYSGDFRMHGEMPSLTGDFMRTPSEKKPDVLIVEHTNILDGEVSSEADVERKLNDVVEKAGCLVIADFSIVDVDRYRTFSRVAERAGRELVVTPKRGFMLKKMEEDRRLSIPELKKCTCSGARGRGFVPFLSIFKRSFLIDNGYSLFGLLFVSRVKLCFLTMQETLKIAVFFLKKLLLNFSQKHDFSFDRLLNFQGYRPKP